LFDPKESHFGTWIWMHDVELEDKRTMNDLTEHPLRPGKTPLYYAAFCGFIGLAKYLIDTHGEDVNAECGRHRSPLHAASHQGHADVARLLLDHGADVNSRKGYHGIPLRRAFDGRHIEVMRVLLEHGADVDYNIFGTLLHDASYHGPAEIVHLLLQHNANVNVKGYNGYTPLHLASLFGHTEVVRLLLEYGADVHVKDKYKDTPLDKTIGQEYHDIVQLLLEHGAKHGRGAGTSTP
jgi:ankyrin